MKRQDYQLTKDGEFSHKIFRLIINLALKDLFVSQITGHFSQGIQIKNLNGYVHPMKFMPDSNVDQIRNFKKFELKSTLNESSVSVLRSSTRYPAEKKIEDQAHQQKF